MDSLGSDFNITGSVMSKQELEEVRKKRGECVTCGRKCFRKKLFKMVPLDEDGKVLNGRCLTCKPLLPRDILEATKHNSSNTVLTSRTSSGASSSAGTPTTAIQQAQPILTAPVSRRGASSHIDFDRYSRNQRNMQPRSLQNIHSRHGEGGTDSCNASTTPLSYQGKGASRSFHHHPMDNFIMARHSFSVSPANQAPPPPPTRARSELSLSSIGSASVSATAVSTNKDVPQQQRVTPTSVRSGRSGGSTVMGADVPPTTPIRTSSGSWSPARVGSKGVMPHHHDRELETGTTTGHQRYHQDNARGIPPPGPPPTLSPFFSPSRKSALNTVEHCATSSSQGSTNNSNPNSATATPSREHSRTDREYRSMTAPTPNELEQARRTILAAQQSGLYPSYSESGGYETKAAAAATGVVASASAAALPTNLGWMTTTEMTGSYRQRQFQNHAPVIDEYELHIPPNTRLSQVPPSVVIHDDGLGGGNGDIINTMMGRMESEVTLDTFVLPHAIKSGTPRSEDSSLVDDIETAMEIPAHGVLNRGGAFVPPSMRDGISSGGGGDFTPRNSCRWSNGGGNGNGDRAALPGKCASFHTMSSMSSYEDELQQQQRARGHNNMADLFETSESSVSKDDEKLLESESYTKKTSTAESKSMKNPLTRKSSGDTDYLELSEALRDSIGFEGNIVSILADLCSIKFQYEDFCHLADVGTPKVIVEAMCAHEESVEVLRWACRAIQSMSGIERTQVDVVTAGGLDALLQVLKRFPGHRELVRSAIAAISNLSASERNLGPIVEKGTVETLVQIVGQHSECVSILSESCKTFANVASHDSRFKQGIMERGAGEALVTMTVVHQTDANLLAKAMIAIRNLCVSCDTNKVAIANFGVCDSVIATMGLHRDVAEVQQECAWLMAVLCGVDENRHSLGDNGGPDLVIRAMWVHCESSDVVEQCLKALDSLTLDRLNAGKVLELDGIKATLNSMQAHAQSANIQQLGCAILANLAELSNQVKMDIVDSETLDAISMAMVCHENNSAVQAIALETLRTLAIEENFASLLAASFLELADKTAKRFPEECGVSATELIRVLGKSFSFSENK